MARKVFFSFDYDRDAWRAGQVRNSNLLPTEDKKGYVDAVEWESIKKQDKASIERWINDQLTGTSVTAVLIGAETADSEWVQYEIVQSWSRGNGLVGIWIHNIKDQDSKTDVPGRNPLDDFELSDGTILSSVCETHDWVMADGRNNLGTWVDEAVKRRARYATESEIVPVKKARRTAHPVVSSGFAPRAPWSPK